MVPGEVAMVALMKRVEAEKIGPRSDGRGGALGRSGDRGPIVTAKPDSPFADVEGRGG